MISAMEYDRKPLETTSSSFNFDHFPFRFCWKGPKKYPRTHNGKGLTEKVERGKCQKKAKEENIEKENVERGKRRNKKSWKENVESKTFKRETLS